MFSKTTARIHDLITSKRDDDLKTFDLKKFSKRPRKWAPKIALNRASKSAKRDDDDQDDDDLKTIKSSAKVVIIKPPTFSTNDLIAKPQD